MSTEPPTLDEALDTVKYGTYQYRVLFFACLCCAAMSMESNLLVFLSPCASEYFGQSAVAEADLGTAVFSTSVIGTLVLGVISDVHGRWVVDMGAAAMGTMFGMLSATSTKYYQLVIYRSFVGFSLGSAMQNEILIQVS